VWSCLGVSHSARNCAYPTFQYKGAKYSLQILLKPTTAIIAQTQANFTFIPESQAMEYFKSIHHVCIVCVHLYGSAISAD
jgi:hypothetical protein